MNERIHDLKCDWRFFLEVKENRKRAECRRLDRDFRLGDYLLLRETHDGQLTGAKCLRMVTHILTSDDFPGIAPGYAILSIAAGGFHSTDRLMRLITNRNVQFVPPIEETKAA